MNDLFEVVFGSVTGNDHKWSGRNNQDMYHCFVNDDVIIAVVCDGCTGGKNSEVGAKIGAKIIVESLRNTLINYGNFLQAAKKEAEEYKVPQILKQAWSWILEKVRREAIEHFFQLSLIMGGAHQTVEDYFLFTVFGVVITKNEGVIFSIGDGVAFINGEEIRVGPFPNNEPPYLAYGGLINSSLSQVSSGLLNFQIHKIIPFSEIKSILIGTDGVTHLADAADKKMPGKDILVGPISQFWEDDHYYKNWDNVRRKLTLANRESIIPLWPEKILKKESGLLPDDVTLVVIRRKKPEKEG